MDQTSERGNGALESLASGCDLGGEHPLGALRGEPVRRPGKQGPGASPANIGGRSAGQGADPRASTPSSRSNTGPGPERWAWRASRARNASRSPGSRSGQFRQSALVDLPADAPTGSEALESSRPAQGDKIDLCRGLAFKGRASQPGRGQQLAGLGEDSPLRRKAQPRELQMQRHRLVPAHAGTSPTTCNGSGADERIAGS